MDLLKAFLDNAGSAKEIGSAVGLDPQAASGVIGKLMPAMTGGLQKNLQDGGLDSLTQALQSGNHQQYVDNPAALASANATTEGNGILGHLLGSKDASRQLASAVGSETGVDSGIIKKMLPMVAALAMGTLSKETDGGQKLQGGDAGGLLGGLLGGFDSDDALGAVGNLAKKLF